MIDAKELISTTESDFRNVGVTPATAKMVPGHRTGRKLGGGNEDVLDIYLLFGGMTDGDN